MSSRREILKVLVGSHAHGLATPESDYDYRGVYVVPTSKILSLTAGKIKGSHWVEGEDQDATSYEIGHFLNLALRCNPTILEVFRGTPCLTGSTTESLDPLGHSLQMLFPYVWNPKDVANAFTGYSLNQRKKLLDDHMGRRWKYATAYIRVLLQAVELLTTGTFNLHVQDCYEGSIKRLSGFAPFLSMGMVVQSSIPGSWSSFLRAVKQGLVPMGIIIDVAEELRKSVRSLADEGPFRDHSASPEKIDEFLLQVRKENW